ncbi:MAG: TRAP transporter substrate-binding protein [Lentisphaeria bacterium]
MLKHFTYCLLASLALVLSACKQNENQPNSQNGASKKAKTKAEFVLSYSIFFPSTHIHAILAEQWAEEVHQRSGGRIRVNVYPGGVLSSASENFECVRNGVSDLGMSCFSYSRGMFPMIEGLDLPWGYQSGKQATKIANAYIRNFNPAELNEVAFMFAHAHGPGILASRKKINTAAEFSGMTVRGTGLSAQMIQALKGNPVGMSQGDAYEALRKGVVDATLCPIETLKGWKQGEVIDYVIRIPAIAYTTVVFLVMNKNTWEKLPPELQQIITEVNLEWQDKHGQAWDDADLEGEQFVRELGKTIMDFPPQENDLIHQAFTPMFQDWAAKLEEKQLPGKQALQFLSEQFTPTKQP